jgi:hypothetical protein
MKPKRNRDGKEQITKAEDGKDILVCVKGERS